jgi:hypothetical protein
MDGRQQRKQDVHRRRLGRSLAVAGIVGALALVGFELWLRELAQGNDTERALRMVAASSRLINLAIAVLAAVLGRFLIDWARQTREQGQWPPAGLEWPGNRPVRHGDQARRTAAQLRAGGVALVGLAFALAAWTAWRAFA